MKLLRCLFLSLALSSPWASSANTLLTDLSDLWWNPHESGWGVTVTRQGNVAFLTFFIFGQDGKSTWYAGQAVYGGRMRKARISSAGLFTKSTGRGLEEFVHAQVGARAVGTVDFTAFLNTATLHYTIDGTEVTKTVSRQTFRTFELTGEYLGAMKSTQSLCFSPAVSLRFPFGLEELTEPLGVAGSLLNWKKSDNRLAMVIDVGAGTSDFSLYRLSVDPTRGKNWAV